MTLENFVTNLFDITKNKIINLAKTELENKEKKERLDEWVEEQAIKMLDILPLNFICKWAIKKYLIPILPTVTQSIYDLLKAKVKELNV